MDSVETTSKCREVSLFQRLICTQEYTTGTSETVLIREVSLFQRLICAQEYSIGTSETVLIREVSFKRGSTAVCNFVHITDLTQCVLPGLEATVVVICM